MMGLDRKALGVIWTIFLFGLLLTIVWFIRSTLVVFAAAIILVPILAFFFLKDARIIRKALTSSFDDGQNRRTFQLILDDIHNVLRNYIRALVLLAIASFCAWALFLSLMRYPYELLLAGVSAILEFIPVVGPAAGLIVLLTVCIVTGS